jgi:TatD DNase family protein
MLCDAHCHILDPRLIERADSIVENLSADGLEFIVETSASAPESVEALKFAQLHKNVYCTIGVHPCMINTYTQDFEKWCLGLKRAEGSGVQGVTPCAFGEIGLDYHHMTYPKDEQKRVFVAQILLADKLGLPLVIHTREAFDDTLEILVQNKKHIRNGLLFHCFSQSAAEVEKIRAHFDAYYSLGGQVTYKTPIPSLDTIRAIPIDRMLLETDSPYLNPQETGGKKILNEPKNIRHTAAFIAKLLNMPFEELATRTLSNTKRFYKIH